jgi:hypothetical protein
MIAALRREQYANQIRDRAIYRQKPFLNEGKEARSSVSHSSAVRYNSPHWSCRRKRTC